MRYEKSDRVQGIENYCCPVHFMEDVINTLFDEDLGIDQVHIIADTYLTEIIFKTICKININDFDFDLTVVKFNAEDYDTDEYRITILNDGQVFVEPAIDKNAEYYDCDGFIFAESEVSEDAYSGNNRHCDVMVFEIEDI